MAEGEAIDGIILIYERILFLIRTLNDIFDVLEIDQGEAKIKRGNFVRGSRKRRGRNYPAAFCLYAKYQKAYY